MINSEGGYEREMSAAEKFLEAVEDEEEEDEGVSCLTLRRRQMQRTRRKNQATIDEFLGPGKRTSAVGILPRYYAELLTWAFHRYLDRETWKISASLGYGGPEPVYMDISTG